MRVVGLDGFRAAWLAVVLADGRFAEARIVASLAEACERYADAARLGVDVPIGLPPRGGRRRADVEARTFVGPRHASVFPTPSAEALAATTYATARAVDPSLSAQSFALGRKILEANELAARNRRLLEVHPEVSFCALHGRPLPHAKRSWNGVVSRRRLLAAEGIEIPDDLGDAGRAAADDVLDAAAAAWSALRAARGEAAPLPDPPERLRSGALAAIWY